VSTTNPFVPTPPKAGAPSPVKDYRNGAAGFIQWAEDNVFIKIFPMGFTTAAYVPLSSIAASTPYNGVSTKEYNRIWEEQKDEIRRALIMEKGRFKHRLLVFCWMRGEGKSVIACLLQLWKFFCFPKQMIVLGANSKDQTKFVHYDVMTELIMNSPRLLGLVGEKNIQTNEIRLRDSRGYVMSTIRTISSFSGIVSNITGYTFSEMFDMKNPKYFVQLDGSIRNIPNAFGVIDSTVSNKQHVLYKLYESSSKGLDDTTFFSYRSSPHAELKDYWNPNQSDSQLASYRAKFPFGEFERYFQNLWSAGTERVFSPEVIQSIRYIGADGLLGQHEKIMDLVSKQQQILDNIDKLAARQLSKEEIELDNSSTMKALENRLWPINRECSMSAGAGRVRPVSASELMRLGDLFDTDWCVVTGLDRADPMKERTGARTILSCVAKGLIGSRSDVEMARTLVASQEVPFYIYILLYLRSISDHSAEVIKSETLDLQAEYNGIDMFTSERWGAWDFPNWCEEHDIPVELVYPTYDKQKIAFFELFIACRDGRFKAPIVPFGGHKMDDLLQEEMSVFDHNPDPPKWFGSPEKKEKYGIQDDSIYSIGWGIYGGRALTIDNFRSIKGTVFFGDFFKDKTLSGKY
jgi:hypothetical protein